MELTRVLFSVFWLAFSSNALVGELLETKELVRSDLQDLRVEVISEFLERRSRHRRATEEFEWRPELRPVSNGSKTFEFLGDSMERRSVFFNGKLMHFRETGLFEIDPKAGTEFLKSGWPTSKDQFVAASFSAILPTGKTLFVLVCDKNPGFSYIYVLSSRTGRLKSKQKIRTFPAVTDARFFQRKSSVYLVMTTANSANSLANCPIYKWAGQYFDEIHSVHARGANSVDVIIDEENAVLIAISQYQDSFGNSEIGTQVLRLDSEDELEKLQLLPSVYPVHVHFTKLHHEVLLIVAQRTEGANVFVFGGHDFSFNQKLESITGENVVLASIRSPDGDTCLIAASGPEISSYCRDETGLASNGLMFYTEATLLYQGEQRSNVTGIVFQEALGAVSTRDGAEEAGIKCAVTWRSEGGEEATSVLKVFEMGFVKVPLGPVMRPRNELGSCFESLQEKLGLAKPFVDQLKALNPTVIRRDDHVEFNGTLVLNQIQLERVEVRSLEIGWEASGNTEHLKASPPATPTNLAETLEKLQRDLKTIEEKLPSLLDFEQPTTVTQEIHFVNVTVESIKASKTNVSSTINGHRILDLKSKALRKSQCENGGRLEVTGSWKVDTVEAEDVGVDFINGILVADVLLKRSKEPQTVEVPIKFQGPTKVTQIDIEPEAALNGIEINDLATKSRNPVVITGLKRVEKLELGTEVHVDFLNGISLEHLRTKALKTHCGSGTQKSEGALVFEGDLSIDHLQVDRVNGVDWDGFRGDVLLDGVDQVIKGSPKFGHLESTNLEAGLVQGVPVDELMDKDSEQTVHSKVRCGTLKIRGNAAMETVNGVKLEDFVLKEADTTISSGIDFEDDVQMKTMDFGDIEAAAINEFRTPFGGVSNRVVMYELATGADNFTVEEIQSENVFVSQINQWPLDDLESTFKLDSSKEVFDPERSDYLESHVVITNGLTVGSLNGHLLEEYVKTTDEAIAVELQFDTVYCNNDVEIQDGGLLNGVDLAKWNSNVVRRSRPGTITGNKVFETRVSVPEGLEAKEINGIEMTEFVMLNSTNKIVSGLKFKRGLKVGSLHVEGPLAGPEDVNGFRLAEIQRTTVKAGVEEATVLDSVKFQNPVSVSQMAIGNNLNDLTLQPWLDHAIRLSSDQSQVIAHDLNILGDLVCEDEVSVSKLNGIEPTGYFKKLANLNTDEHIDGSKTFRGQVTFEEDLQCDSISKVHLRSLANEYVSKTKNQELTGTVRTERLIVDPEVFDQVCFPEGLPQGRSLGDEDTSRAGSRTVVHTEPHSLPLRLEKLDCRDVSWESDNLEHESLHRLLKSAVLKSAASQTVVGLTEFVGDVTIGNFQSANWVREVDFSEIAKDGIRTGVDDGRPIVFSGNYNLDEITVGSEVDSIQVTQFDTRTINSYELDRIDEKLVKRDEVMPIRGRKTLGKSLKSNSVYAEQISGCNVHEVLTTGGEVVAGAVKLELVEGAVGNVGFEKLNLFDWEAFKMDLVLNGTDQTIEGQWSFVDGVHVQDFTADQVNDVALKSTVKTVSNTTQDIHGKKDFVGLKVLGDIQASEINSHDIGKIAEQVVCKDAEHKFEAPVAFGENAIFKDLEAGAVNGRNVTKVLEAFRNHETAVASEMELAPEKVKVAARALDILKSEVASAARGPLYLDSNFYFHNRRAAEVRSTSNADGTGYQLAFIDYRRVDQNQCGLPNGCFSPSTSSGVFKADEQGVRLQNFKCQRRFSLAFDDGLQVGLVSEATTYNSTCVSVMDKRAILKIQDGESDIEVPFNNPGTVKDANVFGFEGQKYIVVVQVGHDEAVGIYHELVVYKLDLLESAALETVQVIPLRTASKFDVDFVSDNWFLAIGPSFDSVGSSSAHIDLTEISDHAQESLSEVYVWSSGDLQFINLRDIPTGKVTDFEFVTVNRGRQCEKSFLFVGHTGNLVDVFVFDGDLGNFLQYQVISVEAPVVTSIEKFEVGSGTFVAIGTSEGLAVYGYRGVEGFKLQMPPVPVESVNMISRMDFREGPKLAIASSLSMIADVVSL